MTSKITITPQELRQSSQRFKRGADETNQLLRNLTSEVNNLKSEWQGAAHNAFFEQFNSLKPTLVKFIDVCNGINKQLNDVARTMEEVDREIASKMK